MRRPFALATLSLALLVAPHARAGVPRRASREALLLVRVIDDVSREPLPNAEVIDEVSGARRFTDERGEARIAWPADGRLTLLVRQIGYQFQTRAIARDSSDAANGMATFALGRIAYTLPGVFTRETSQCAATDSVSRALAVLVLAQLRLGAERYESFRKAYPFRVRLLRRTLTFDLAGQPQRRRESHEEVDDGHWGDRYRPGEIVELTASGFSVPILFVATLADAEFWRHHCFAVHGIETVHESRVLRLDFAPTPDTRTPDWEGSALVDSASSILRRIEFRLVNLGPRDRPRRLEGHTTFASPSPFIAIPDTTVGMWWRRGPDPDGDWGRPDVAQLLRVESLRFRKRRPMPARD